MSERAYQSTVVVSAIAWFLLGLHAPVMHQITHHHRMRKAELLFTTLGKCPQH